MRKLINFLNILLCLGFATPAQYSFTPTFYPGCTDPIALNYDPEATVDDGSCVYSIGPDLIIIAVTPGTTYCNGINHPVYNFQVTLVNIGTEVVDSFCLDDFLSSTDFTCYNGPLGMGMQIEPLDTITVGGSFVISNGWNTGQMNFMTINSIPGEIVTGNNNFVFQMPESEDCLDPEPEQCDTVYIDVEVPFYIHDTLYIELPPDTIIQTQIDTIITTEYVYITDSIMTYITDTVFVEEYVYITDTLIIEFPPDTVVIQLPPDTITLTEIEFVYDTIYIDNYIYEYDTLYLTEYITLTDTITEYIIQEIWIDCNTGLPCEEDPPGIDCPDWTTLHIPNTFTPNNDGFNDTWKIIYDLYCWENVEFWIYNRWGEEIYHAYGSSFDSYPFWDGSVQGGNYYVADGVYVYIVEGKKVGRAEVVKEQGHITVFR